MHKLLFLQFLFLIFGTSSLYAAPFNQETERQLSVLDSIISHYDIFVQQKHAKLDLLYSQKRGIHDEIGQYWLNRAFYDEYFVFDSDSALMYVNRNMELAKRLKNKDWEIECRIKRSFLQAATGLLTQAEAEMEGINGASLPRDLKIAYYSQMIYLYSHFNQYAKGDESLEQAYRERERLYQDSICAIVTPEDPEYLWNMGWRYIETDKIGEISEKLQEKMKTSKFEDRNDATNAYLLACIFRNAANEDLWLQWLAKSAIADIRFANHDIASLEELAQLLFGMGDIDRAYVYINYCLQRAQQFHNRVRVVSISQTQKSIQDAFMERDAKRRSNLQLLLILLTVISVVLLFVAIQFFVMLRKLSRSRKELNETNKKLEQNQVELASANTHLELANTQLQNLNSQLESANTQLLDSNYIKEEYIGYVFAICSNYISKLDEYRKNINRKLKANLFEEARSMTDSPTMAQAELKEFYHNFDVIFLHVYPDFVNDFNQLLIPEERIVLKEGELLNTDLRIYALVRLGINDSVKIAEFLHCSAQTVYNNRLKVRNKAIIPKDKFAETVRNLGKL